MYDVWTTKDGTEIPISQLEDSHLINILRLVKRKYTKGYVERYGGGGYDGDDVRYGEENIRGMDTITELDWNLYTEATLRGLTKLDFMTYLNNSGYEKQSFVGYMV